MQQQYRHGDLLFIRIAAMPAGAVPQGRTDGRGGQIAAYGEATGHAHRVYDAERLIVEASGLVEQYFAAGAGAYLDHEDHGIIPLPAGDYRVIIQRVYAPDAIRNVVD